MPKRTLSTHDLEKLIKKSFEVHPIKTIMRADYFLKCLEKKGVTTVSVRNMKVVIKSYLRIKER
jgi:hypothetical protein